jgi:hypothetical protein
MKSSSRRKLKETLKLPTISKFPKPVRMTDSQKQPEEKGTLHKEEQR